MVISGHYNGVLDVWVYHYKVKLAIKADRLTHTHTYIHNECPR